MSGVIRFVEIQHDKVDGKGIVGEPIEDSVDTVLKRNALVICAVDVRSQAADDGLGTWPVVDGRPGSNIQ